MPWAFKCTQGAVEVLLFPGRAFAQDKQPLAGELAQLYNVSPGDNLIGGFSVASLIGALIFGGIGFIAFMYGKKNAEMKPILFGIALMVYPYFIKGALALYAAGIGLTACLYFFRE